MTTLDYKGKGKSDEDEKGFDDHSGSLSQCSIPKTNSFLKSTNSSASDMKDFEIKKPRQLIGLIHDSRHVGFQIVMQISHVFCWGANIGKKANCGKSALRNIEITFLKVRFRTRIKSHL